jgi:hypothetical protein
VSPTSYRYRRTDRRCAFVDGDHADATPAVSIRLFGLIPFDRICCLGLGGKLVV